MNRPKTMTRACCAVMALVIGWGGDALADTTGDIPVAPGDLIAGQAREAPVSVVRIQRPGLYDLKPGRVDLTQLQPPMLAAAGFDEFGADDADRVSVARATLYSLVLPGAGQWYSGAKNRAGVFLASEGIAWVLFGYFETVGAIKRQDYETLALTEAGIDPTDKDDNFYRTITFYDSRADYNEAGRIIRPQRPYYPDVAFWDWQWSSSEQREEYRTLRNQSNEAFNRGKMTLGALLLNRLVAAVDAWRTAKSVNRRARMELSGWKMRFKAKPLGRNPRVRLTFSRRF